jgi:hypothetical protein
MTELQAQPLKQYDVWFHASDYDPHSEEADVAPKHAADAFVPVMAHNADEAREMARCLDLASLEWRNPYGGLPVSWEPSWGESDNIEMTVNAYAPKPPAETPRVLGCCVKCTKTVLSLAAEQCHNNPDNACEVRVGGYYGSSVFDGSDLTGEYLWGYICDACLKDMRLYGAFGGPARLPGSVPSPLLNAESKDHYDVMKAQMALALDATELICGELKRQGVSRTEFARRLRLPPVYVDSLLDSDGTLTVGSVAEMLHAIGRAAVFTLVPPESV